VISRLAAALAAALLLAACGSDGDGRYDARVDEVRQAVEAGDREAALATLDQLGAEAFAAHAEGEVSAEELAALAGLLEQARSQLDDELPEVTTTTTTTAPPTTPVFESDSSDEEDEDEKKKGKGRGRDDGDDDDDD
jgi:hypothetical protein